MITIRTYTISTEAYIAKGLLESEGIEAQLLNAEVVQMVPLGDIALQVVETEAELAKSILESVE